MEVLKQTIRVLKFLYLTVTVALAFQMASRSLDYITGNPRPGVGFLGVVGLEPPTVWGITGLISVGVVVVGLILRKTLIISVGGIFLVILYLTFAWMNVVSIVGEGPPYDDWRNLTAYLSAAAIWGAISFVGVLFPSLERVEGDLNGVLTEPNK